MKKYLAGVDIGNSSTEVSIASLEDNCFEFVSTFLTQTTGVKGTPDNIKGIRFALQEAAKLANITLDEVYLIRLNEAVPVIGDLAMDLISETIITESSMIGHNPNTPGGAGLGVGYTILVDHLTDIEATDQDFIVVVPESFDYEWVAYQLNRAESNNISITGAIIQKDDGVLIQNRINKEIPIVDEVRLIDRVPLSTLAAVEVALPGHVIRTLSNPYGLSTVFNLNPEQTIQTSMVAKALVGNRSAVVIRTPQGEVVERKIEAGHVILIGSNQQLKVSINDGAEAIMNTYEKLEILVDVRGETGTNVGGMFNGLRHNLAQLTEQLPSEIKVADFLAVDAVIPTSISGSMAGELSMESGVALASMVKTDEIPVQRVATLLEQEVKISVEVGGVEAEMAIRGALTTPGTRKPIIILDIGGGSTDAAMMNKDGKITSCHLAGAGDMVTMLINSELALDNKELAEKVKKFPLGKVMSLYHMQLEDGTILFCKTPFPPHTFGKVVIREDQEYTPLSNKAPMEKIREIRRSAKRKVFVTNAQRALKRVIPTGNLKHISFVVMVGGSALDFEIPQMITEELGKYGIVAGFANIRGTEGPRNAVATGLVLSSVGNEVIT